MKLSAYIQELQALLLSEGDLNIIYSTDDEGNAYHELNTSPSVTYVDDLDTYYLETVEDEEDSTKVILMN